MTEKIYDELPVTEINVTFPLNLNLEADSLYSSWFSTPFYTSRFSGPSFPSWFSSPFYPSRFSGPFCSSWFSGPFYLSRFSGPFYSLWFSGPFYLSWFFGPFSWFLIESKYLIYLCIFLQLMLISIQDCGYSILILFFLPLCLFFLVTVL